MNRTEQTGSSERNLGVYDYKTILEFKRSRGLASKWPPISIGLSREEAADIDDAEPAHA